MLLLLSGNYYYLKEKKQVCRDFKHSGGLGFFFADKVINKICKKNKRESKKRG